MGGIGLGRGRAPALVQVRIDGPVLLLMGPIGLFFARFCRYLQGVAFQSPRLHSPCGNSDSRLMSVCLTAGDGVMALLPAPVD